MTGTAYAGRTAAVTGTRKGLGRLLAEHFLEEGARVVGLSRGAGTIEHPNYTHLAADVTDEASMRSAFVSIARSHGGLDTLINNAGVLTTQHALVMPGARAEEMIRTNVLGAFYASREAAKLMRKGKFGRIVNIGSMASVLEPAGDSIYAASKAALISMATVLAKEFAGFGITVNTVGVTAIETEMLAQIPPEKLREIIAGLPIARLATPDDVFNVVDFFASRDSAYVTAQAVFLGGLHA